MGSGIWGGISGKAQKDKDAAAAKAQAEGDGDGEGEAAGEKSGGKSGFF